VGVRMGDLSVGFCGVLLGGVFDSGVRGILVFVGLMFWLIA